MMILTRLPALIVAAFAAFALPAFAGDLRMDKASGCKVFLADFQSALTPQWHGACESGTAQGLGVVRLFQSGQFQGAYYGTMVDGKWRLGVYWGPNGAMAGSFVDNVLQQSDDRNAMIKAFDTGAEAARSLAKSFSDRGNAASAKHYGDIADKLAAWLD